MQLASAKLTGADGGISWNYARARYKRAYRLMMEAGRLNAQECLKYGLVKQVVSAITCRRARGMGAANLRIVTCRECVDQARRPQALELSLPQRLRSKRSAKHRILSADCEEGITAFLENAKRNSLVNSRL